MINTTLVYLFQQDKVLLLYRNKKRDDPNAGKWVGVGGHCEAGESPHDCAVREVYEETGLTLRRPVYRGLVTFVSEVQTEYMHVFTCSDFTGDLRPCDEGLLRWVDAEDVPSLPMWAGDRVFLPLLKTDAFFSVKLVYEGDRLVRQKIYPS